MNVVKFAPKPAATFTPRVVDLTNRITAAACSLAELAGESIDDMTPERMDAYRSAAKFAVDMLHPERVQVLAYTIERERSRKSGAVLHNQLPRERRGHIAAIVYGLRVAREMAQGKRPEVDKTMTDLCDADEMARIQHGESW